MRSRNDRVIAGVCGGLARRLEIDALLVRIAMVVLVAGGGLGILLYLVLWAVLPLEPEPEGPPAGAQTAPDATRGRATGLTGRLPGGLGPRRLLALAMMGVGGLLLVRALGLWLGDSLVWPLVLVAAGSVIVWARGSSDASTATSLAGTITAPVSPVRIAVGVALAVAGVGGFLAANVSLTAVRDLLLALLAAAIGLGLLLAPWLWRLGTQLTAERHERIRQEERAQLAAHLHDSVLQTLALIQRASDQPRRMVTLARRQERELRTWLYGQPSEPEGDRRMATATRALGEEVEAVHGIEVEVVVVGDAPLDDDLDALLGAVREACVNAAKHAGVPSVDVYVEVEADETVAFVRDRGHGFDLDAVASDRRGIRDSIVGRVERRGGRARIHATPGEGTEVELTMPRRAADRGADADISTPDA